MPNPLLTSINRAVYDNRQLGKLFPRYLGTKEHPRGRILSEYRNARRAVGSALKESNKQRAGREVLTSLETAVTAIITEAVNESVSLGIESAETQTQAYIDNGSSITLARQRARTGLLSVAPIATLQQQVTAVMTLIAIGAATSEIIGDGTRLGLLQPAPIQRELARWMAQAVSSGFTEWIVGDADSDDFEFKRQAVAGIDERTTDCCLRVHGQIVGLKEDFHLTGTPRYADDQRDPPFHDYCRTSIALYLPDFDDGYTDDMKEAARLERKARESDNYRAPHPANAFTRVRR